MNNMVELDITNAHILLVEDSREFLTLLVEELTEFGYKNLITAYDAKEAKEKLDQHLFEIIIADMRLAGDGGGGFVVFEEILRRNLTASVIILTANDTVLDCRKAYKWGAWDYIPKNMFGGADPFQELHQSIQEAIKFLNRWGNNKDRQWLEDNSELLQAQYSNQYVAIINQGVIESATTEEALKTKIKERNLPLFLPIIERIEGINIQYLLQQGESSTLEFKESFYYDATQENKKNQKLRFNNLKTIAAFLNSEGGTLLIGVKNDKTIYGLKNDFSILGQQKDQDGFELCLIGMIKTLIGIVFMQFVRTNFIEVDNEVICAVVVKKSTQPAFLKEENKKNLYIRTGNSSQLLHDAEQICQFYECKRNKNND